MCLLITAPGETKGRFCNEHKDPSMINVKNKKCLKDGCKRLARKGTVLQRLKYCNQHAGPDDHVVKSCEVKRCKKAASYSPTGTLPALRCDDHKLATDEELFTAPCVSCNLPWILNEAGLCEICAIPKKRTKPKENFIRERLRAAELKQVEEPGRATWRLVSEDRTVEGTCSNKRPDFLLDYGSKIVIVEVDEEQHKDRPCFCEQQRMLGIFNDFGGTPVLFVRYNPDKYVDDQGVKHQADNKGRSRILLQYLDNLRNTPELPYLCNVVYMYYDGCKPQTMLIQNLE